MARMMQCLRSMAKLSIAGGFEQQCASAVMAQLWEARVIELATRIASETAPAAKPSGYVQHVNDRYTDDIASSADAIMSLRTAAAVQARLEAHELAEFGTRSAASFAGNDRPTIRG